MILTILSITCTAPVPDASPRTKNFHASHYGTSGSLNGKIYNWRDSYSVAAHHPESRFPSPDRFKAAGKSYSIKVSSLSVPDASLGTRNFHAGKQKSRPLWLVDGFLGTKINSHLRICSRCPDFRSYLSIGCRNSYVWMCHLVTRYVAGGAGPKIFFLVLREFILFCKNNWKLDFFLEDLKAFRARGSCSGSALNFWALGRWNGTRPEASLFLLSRV